MKSVRVKVRRAALPASTSRQHFACGLGEASLSSSNICHFFIEDRRLNDFPNAKRDLEIAATFQPSVQIVLFVISYVISSRSDWYIS